MPDFHVMCRSVPEAQEQLRSWTGIYGEVEAIGRTTTCWYFSSMSYGTTRTILNICRRHAPCPYTRYPEGIN